LAACQGVLYTPDREHFGIVPLEAMACGRPVIAVSTGGPLETIIHRVTGFLTGGVPMEFANAIVLLLTMSTEAATKMTLQAREHVAAKFSRSVLRQRWLEVLERVGVPPAGVLPASWGKPGTGASNGKTD
jgi:alpha-1,3/alpha-1,6-mannosyltransferase